MPPEAAEGERDGGHRGEQRQRHDERGVARNLARLGRRRQGSDSDRADDDQHRDDLANAHALPENPSPEHEQQQQPERQGGLDQGDWSLGQRQHLEGEPQEREDGGREPAAPLEQVSQQRDAHRVPAGRLARLERLERVARVVTRGRGNR